MAKFVGKNCYFFQDEIKKKCCQRDQLAIPLIINYFRSMNSILKILLDICGHGRQLVQHIFFSEKLHAYMNETTLLLPILYI